MNWHAVVDYLLHEAREANERCREETDAALKQHHLLVATLLSTLAFALNRGLIPK